MTKGLQIRLVEEESCASPVRDDVVHIRRFRQLSLLHALLAVGVLEDEALPERLPTPAVAALRRRSSHLATACIACGLRLGFDFSVALGAGLRMAIAIALTARNRGMTAGVGTESK